LAQSLGRQRPGIEVQVFLDLTQLKSGTNPEEDSGNFALLDMVKALQFIRRDILTRR